ncbi:hypothetical protein D0Z07_7365 [Hyphodiscus hymeniophilus]|uniref:Sexual development protein n=1 Tax=Hyphodiscus hymeniophilus TaxID=353542 RepID=A0A9P7AU28_9HELO|nr:hypothetical protein D0Z07_7365 [Hyphodiscus hymeniophilus]
MRTSIVSAVSLVGLSCLSVVSAAPFTYKNDPLSNGFPNLAAGDKGKAELAAIEQQALGSLSNAPPPPVKPQNDSLTSLRLIAFNELFEVAFFTELLSNLTNEVDGYQIHHQGAHDFIVRALTAVQAQEELHVLNANNALAHFNESIILPCEYNFPVSNFEDAIALASTFTDLVLGTLQDVQTVFGADGDVGLIRGVGSVIGQEGEQNGFYRQLLDKTPSALPFLTTSTREFAFSALQGFVVPGSCGNLDAIDLPIFAPLTVDATPLDCPEPKPVNLDFSFTLPSSPAPAAWGSDYAGLSLVYINQQNLPVVEPLLNPATSNGVVTFQALFPFNGTTFGNGLTIAAVTNSSGPFANANAVANHTVFGPGLIEVH